MLHIVLSSKFYKAAKAGFYLDYYFKQFINLILKFTFFDFSVNTFDKHFLEDLFYKLFKANTLSRALYKIFNKTSFVKYFSVVVYCAIYASVLILIIVL